MSLYSSEAERTYAWNRRYAASESASRLRVFAEVVALVVVDVDEDEVNDDDVDDDDDAAAGKHFS